MLRFTTSKTSSSSTVAQHRTVMSGRCEGSGVGNTPVAGWPAGPGWHTCHGDPETPTAASIAAAIDAGASGTVTGNRTGGIAKRPPLHSTVTDNGPLHRTLASYMSSPTEWPGFKVTGIGPGLGNGGG